jgi:hypothetical protein
LTRLANRSIQEIETREVRPGRQSPGAYFFALHERLACFPLFLLVPALVMFKRPLRRGIDSKREFTPVGTAACRSSCILQAEQAGVHP